MRRLTRLLVMLLSLSMMGCSNSRFVQVEGGSALAGGGRYAEAMWSADGNQIAVVHTPQNGQVTLEVLNRQGSVLRSTTPSDGMPRSPGWRGSDVLFLAGPLDSTTLEVATKADVHPVLKIPRAAVVSWARDGHVGVVSKDSRLWLLDTEKLALTDLGFSRIPAEFELSPSGRYLAFVRQDVDGGTLAVRDLGANGVTDLWHVSYSDGVLAGICWSPDETFVGIRKTQSASSGFYLLNPRTAAPPRLLTTVDMVNPDWSPDGKHIVYTTVGIPGSNELQILAVPQLPDR